MKIVKRILIICILLFSVVGIISAIGEYTDGYDEIVATVNNTWKSQKKKSTGNKYTIVWKDLKGESHQAGRFANKENYEKGDQIVIRVDKKTHENRYAPTSHLVLSILLFVIGMLLFIGTMRREHRVGNHSGV